MSPLWNCKNTMKLKTRHMRPSPNENNSNQSLAQGFKNSIDRNIIYNPITRRTIKGISLFTFLQTKVKGSMTIEAAMVLPIFLFFFLNLSCAIEMIRLHNNLQVALCETGDELSIYGYAISRKTELENAEIENADEDSFLKKIGEVVFSYGYVRSQIVKYAGEKYLNQSPLTYGADGLQFLESNIFRSGDSFDVVTTYSVSPWSSYAGFFSFRMANRYYGHVWNGYEIPLSNEAGLQGTVYIAKNGEVYHEDRKCSYINLAIREIPITEVSSYRNSQGEKYMQCQVCEKNNIQTVIFITEDGNRYHYSKECASIKRTVFSMLKGEALEQKYRGCSRCANT